MGRDSAARIARLAGLLVLFLLVALGCSDGSSAPSGEVAEGGAEVLQAVTAPEEVERRKARSKKPRKDHAEYVGRWRKLARKRADSTDLTAEQKEQLERLRAIGYVGGSVKSDRSGLTAYSREAVEPGLNFFTSGHGPVALLMNMRGRILHRWRYEYADVWPESPLRNRPAAKWWRRAHLFENGDVIAIYEGLGIIKIDKDSQLLWANELLAHHDLSVRPNGDIWVLTRSPKKREEEGDLVIEDFFTVLDSEGREKRSTSIMDAFLDSQYADWFYEGREETGDMMHTNTLHVLDGRLAGRDPAFRKGNVLVSMNAIGVIAVFNPEAGKIEWARRGEWDDVTWFGQHDPHILDNGNMLFFENNYEPRKSRLREIDPLTGEEKWFYAGNELSPFYSLSCGAAIRLANGNTLVTSTDAGRVFEVDPEGRIAWEYFNPRRAGDKGEYIATISELLRVPLDFADSWLK